MARKLFWRLAAPSYDVDWLTLSDKSRGDYALIAGGGGTGNTGVKNQVQVAAYSGKGEFEFLRSFETDSEGRQRFCSGVCHGVIDGVTVVCALLETDVLLLSVAQAKGEEGQQQQSLEMSRLVEFKADFAEKEPSVNCACVTKEGRIVTGGEDSVVRVWSMVGGNDSNCTINKLHECKGHSAPVMALGKHPREPWVCSASKDGTCKVWNTETQQLLLSIAPIDESSGVPSTASTKLQCRGCCFSTDGSSLFTILCGRKGSTHLLKFSISLGADKTLSYSPQRAVVASKDPSTRLVLIDSGEKIAIGGSNGQVAVFDATTLSKVFSLVAHDDYPVTGLAFAPASIASADGMSCFLVTCSVDNRMATIISRKISMLLVILALLIGLAVIAYFLFLQSGR